MADTDWKCARCSRTGAPLEKAPYPGDLGQEILNGICGGCWQEWLKVQVMVINEYRVNLADSKGVDVIEAQMKGFLFGQGSLPPEYVPPVSG